MRIFLFIVFLVVPCVVSLPDVPSLTITRNYLGCYSNCENGTTLDWMALDSELLDINTCVAICEVLDYSYAGIQNGSQCWCSEDDSALINTNGTCDVTCLGNSEETCGGICSTSVFHIIPTTQAPSPTSGYYSLGCFEDCYGPNNDLTQKLLDSNDVDINSCVIVCERFGYKYAGLQNGSECWCGNYGEFKPSNHCNVTCYDGGNCGGICANQIYTRAFNRTEGCFSVCAENLYLYAQETFDNSGSNNIQDCISGCNQRGYDYAGLQSSICFCNDNNYFTNPQSNCSIPCPGNASEICGGNCLVTLVTSPYPAYPTPSVYPFFDRQFMGCIDCTSGAQNYSAIAIGNSTILDINLCIIMCEKKNFKYAALQNGKKCLCGNTFDSENIVDTCNTACSGNSSEICGGNCSYSIYTRLSLSPIAKSPQQETECESGHDCLDNELGPRCTSSGLCDVQCYIDEDCLDKASQAYLPFGKLCNQLTNTCGMCITDEDCAISSCLYSIENGLNVSYCEAKSCQTNEDCLGSEVPYCNPNTNVCEQHFINSRWIPILEKNPIYSSFVKKIIELSLPFEDDGPTYKAIFVPINSAFELSRTSLDGLEDELILELILNHIIIEFDETGTIGTTLNHNQVTIFQTISDYKIINGIAQPLNSYPLEEGFPYVYIPIDSLLTKESLAIGTTWEILNHDEVPLSHFREIITNMGFDEYYFDDFNNHKGYLLIAPSDNVLNGLLEPFPHLLEYIDSTVVENCLAPLAYLYSVTEFGLELTPSIYLNIVDGALTIRSGKTESKIMTEIHSFNGNVMISDSLTYLFPNNLFILMFYAGENELLIQKMAQYYPNVTHNFFEMVEPFDFIAPNDYALSQDSSVNIEEEAGVWISIIDGHFARDFNTLEERIAFSFGENNYYIIRVDHYNSDTYINNAKLETTLETELGSKLHIVDRILVPPGLVNSNVNLYEYCKNNLDRFSILLSILNKTQQDKNFADNTISIDNFFTFFAPNDNAFRNLGSNLDNLLHPDNHTMLLDIWNYHILTYGYFSPYFNTEIEARTLLEENGNQYSETKPSALAISEGASKVNDNINVLKKDVHLLNGVLYEIDAVLIPEGIDIIQVTPTPSPKPTPTPKPRPAIIPTLKCFIGIGSDLIQNSCGTNTSCQLTITVSNGVDLKTYTCGNQCKNATQEVTKRTCCCESDLCFTQDSTCGAEKIVMAMGTLLIMFYLLF